MTVITFGKFGEPTLTCRKMDVWKESVAGIGRFEVILENQGNEYGGTISPEDEVVCVINDDYNPVLMGYVDDVLPYVSDSTAVYRNLLKIKGRDYGQDLANLFLTKEYVSTPWDDIFEDALASTVYPSEISYTSSSTGTPLDYSFKNQYLLDGFKEIAKRVLGGLDFYVDNNKRLQAFLLADAPSSGITLKSVPAYPDCLDNNILEVKEIGEQVGFDIRNYIQVEAGDVDDHWTEGNAADYTEWESSSTTAIVDDSTTGKFVKGAQSIKATWGTGYPCFFIQFPKYSYTNLNFSALGTVDCSAYVKFDDTGVSTAYPELYIRDSHGYYAGWGIELAPNKWGRIPFKMGVDQTIYDDGQNRWHWLDYPGSHSGGFSWILDRIGVHITGLSSYKSGTNCWFDGLNLSGITAKGIAVSSGSGTLYRPRMIPLSRSDLKSQMQLDSTAASELAHRKDPTKRLSVTATFQQDALYAGQTIGVNAPSSGIGAVYRIVGIHHSAEPRVDLMRGFDAITEFDLVRADQATIDPLRLRLSQNPAWTYTQRLESKIRSMEQGK